MRRAVGVSIHAPARGATAWRMIWPVASDQFRSTRPRRGTTTESSCGLSCSRVSIHAPARGATAALEPGGNARRRFRSTRPHGARPLIDSIIGVSAFNPRARTGRDPIFRPRFSTEVEFQSTRPHGARHHYLPYLSASRFNPRARTGRDPALIAIGDRWFQSTRPHGARRASRISARRD